MGARRAYTSGRLSHPALCIYVKCVHCAQLTLSTHFSTCAGCATSNMPHLSYLQLSVEYAAACWACWHISAHTVRLNYWLPVPLLLFPSSSCLPRPAPVVCACTRAVADSPARNTQHRTRHPPEAPVRNSCRTHIERPRAYTSSEPSRLHTAKHCSEPAPDRIWIRIGADRGACRPVAVRAPPPLWPCSWALARPRTQQGASISSGVHVAHNAVSDAMDLQPAGADLGWEAARSILHEEPAYLIDVASEDSLHLGSARVGVWWAGGHWPPHDERDIRRTRQEAQGDTPPAAEEG